MKYQTEMIYSAIILLGFTTLLWLAKRYVLRFSMIRKIEPHRKKFILAIIYLTSYIIMFGMLLPVWGVKLEDVIVFMSSVLAVLGVGFFAQWSILSNLTASAVLFFNHPIRIGDRVRIIDKDYNWVGKVKDITGFYFFLKTDDGEEISLPNSLVIQKGIEILPKNQKVEEKDVISSSELVD